VKKRSKQIDGAGEKISSNDCQEDGDQTQQIDVTRVTCLDPSSSQPTFLNIFSLA
jgi:hypothetical protein